MQINEFSLSFENTTLADANAFADELRSALLEAHPGISVGKARSDIGTMDFGSVLVLALGAC